jgi:hypothetical protein
LRIEYTGSIEISILPSIVVLRALIPTIVGWLIRMNAKRLGSKFLRIEKHKGRQEEMKYRKKPIVIEAIQLNWKNWSAVCDFLGDLISTKNPGKYGLASDECGEQEPFINLEIPTPEGTMLALHGDFIIRGLSNEFYPCKPDIFKMTYEPVNETPVLWSTEIPTKPVVFRQATDEDVAAIMGKNLQIADEYCNANGLILRVGTVNGKPKMLTDDILFNRITADLTGGLVQNAKIG